LSDGRRKHAIFWSVVVGWVGVDVVTKAIAEARLLPQVPHPVWGNVVRFALIYNRGAAFGMQVGDSSRWVFTVLTAGALLMLAHLLRETRNNDVPRTLALALVTAGALGNLVDRLRSAKGVIDFIDVGTSQWRFWTFNVADVGVSCGAVLLAIVLWHEERSRHAVRAADEHAAPADVGTSRPDTAAHAPQQ
jgi:signal peptidase II